MTAEVVSRPQQLLGKNVRKTCETLVATEKSRLARFFIGAFQRRARSTLIGIVEMPCEQCGSFYQK
jgi:hypothetical protein